MGSLSEELRKAGFSSVHGGVEQARGTSFEVKALVFFLLARLVDDPELELHVQGPTDALFSFDRAAGKIVELVECKKAERRDERHSLGHSYVPKKVTPTTLKKWKIVSVLDRLKEDPKLHYTLLAFARLSNGLSNLPPTCLKDRPIPIMLDASPLRGFPPDYIHPSSPAPTSGWARGYDEAWCRVRIVPLEEPGRLDLFSEKLLQDRFQVSRLLSSDVRYRIERLILSRRELTVPKERWIHATEVWDLIQAGRRTAGGWRDLEDPHPSHFEPATARSEVDGVWAALKRAGFVVICGSPGQGKTTLCREVSRMARTEWPEVPGGMTRYLSVHHDAILDEEANFLRESLDEPCLFIVDDEHRGQKEAEKLIHVFVDRWRFERPRARLLVTSANAYQHTQVGVAMEGRRGSSLNLAEVIDLPRSSARARRILDGLQESGKLSGRLNPRELVDLAGHNIRLAILLDEAASQTADEPPVASWRNARGVRLGLERWLGEHLSGSIEPSEIDQRLRPIFVLGAYQIGIPRSWSHDVGILERAGFLEVVDGSVNDGMLRVKDRTLAALLAAPTSEKRRLEILCRYIRQHPRHLGQLFGALWYRSGNIEGGRKLANLLAKEMREEISEIFRDHSLSLPDRDLAVILRACGRDSARSLLDSILQPEGTPSPRFFDRRIDFAASPMGLGSLLEAAYRINRRLTSRAVEGLVERRQELLLRLFLSPGYDLHDIASCMRALFRCDPIGTKPLFDRWQTESLETRLAELADGPERLSQILRYCDQIRWIDRRAALVTLERHVSVDAVARAVEHWQDLEPIVHFFGLLQRLHRRLARGALVAFASTYSTRMEAALVAESSLSKIQNEIYYVSRFDRRVARTLCRKAWIRIRALIVKSDNYHEVGTAVRAVSTSLGLQEARRWADEIDRERILAQMKRERRSVNLVGQMLYNTQQVNPGLAEWLASSLDWESYLPRIRDWILPNLGYLLRGFLAATPTAMKSDEVVRMIGSRSLHERIGRGREESPGVLNVVVLPALLMDGGMPPDEIKKLMEPAKGGASFETDILKHLMESHSCEEVAHVLYVLRRLDPILARRGLEGYIGRVRDGRQLASEGGTFLPERTPDLAGLGQLLTIAGAIDQLWACELAEGLSVERLAERADREHNFGRLRSLVSGLSEASHGVALRFLDAYDDPEVWDRNLAATQNFRSTTSYVRTVLLASRSRGIRLCYHLAENQADHVEAELEATASLSTIAGWTKSCIQAGVHEECLARLRALIESAAQFEGRMTSYLEAAEAVVLTRPKNLVLARKLAEEAVRHNQQVRSIMGLTDWVRLYERAQRLEKALGVSGWATRLFSTDEPWHVDALFALERDGAAAGLAWWTIRAAGGIPDESLEAMRMRALRVCDAEQNPLRRALGLTLAGNSTEIVEGAVEDLEGCALWELGLVFLASMVGRRSPSAVAALRAKVTSALRISENRDEERILSNESVRLGLEAHARAAFGPDDPIQAKLFEEVQRRREDEIRIGVKSLLDAQRGPDSWRANPFALHQVFERVLFRASRLTWTEEIDQKTRRGKFG